MWLSFSPPSVLFNLKLSSSCPGPGQVPVRFRLGKEKKAQRAGPELYPKFGFSYSRLLIAYSRLLHSHKLYSTATCSPVKLFSHLLNTPHSNFSATCSTLPTQIFQPLAPNSGMTSKWALSIEPLAPYSPVKLFSHLLYTSHSNFSALNLLVKAKRLLTVIWAWHQCESSLLSLFTIIHFKKKE